MIRHYYTLYKVAEEIRSLKGMLLTECFTQEKNTVLFVFEADRQTTTLECSIDPQWGTLFLKNDVHRARRNTLDLFPALIARPLLDARIADNERIITLSFPGKELHCIFYGGGRGNIILTQEEIIQDAFKSPRELIDTEFHISVPALPSIKDFPPDSPVSTALARSSLLLGTQYAAEVCRQLDIAPETPLHTFSSQEMDVIEDSAEAFRETCLASTRFYILRNSKGVPLLSLSPLGGHTEEQRVHSVSQAIRMRIALTRKEGDFHHHYDIAFRNLKMAAGKAERAMRALEQESRNDERSSERQLYAELLLAQPDPNRKVGKSITVENWDGVSVTILLDKNLTLIENAQRYFEKARNSKEAKGIRQRRLEQYRQQEARLTLALEALQHVKDNAALQRFTEQYSESIRLMNPQQTQQQSPYREFDLGNGYMLYVGKSAANNDELTMRFAKPNDYWFHARGVSGSHTVLRSPGKEKPPKHILLQAAAIAAYYSKARNASLTPVAYTQKKYVRKPKGSAVGAVVLEREEVVMVRPELAGIEKTVE